jgi:hypothetical protein
VCRQELVLRPAASILLIYLDRKGDMKNLIVIDPQGAADTALMEQLVKEAEKAGKDMSLLRLDLEIGKQLTTGVVLPSSKV